MRLRIVARHTDDSRKLTVGGPPVLAQVAMMRSST